MKNIVFIILFFGYSNFIYCQIELSITPSFCHSSEEISNFEHEIELYKEGKIVSKEFYPKNNFTIKNLETGKYVIKYLSIFNQFFEKEINLDAKKKSIVICIDEIRKIKKESFIENLGVNDTLEIWAYETGCEYFDFGKIQLTKNEDQIEVTLSQNGKFIRKFLDEDEINLIQEIEYKIQLIKMNEEEGFLRTTNYEIKLNGSKKVETKFGIQAVGYTQMMKDIFNK